MTMFRMQKSYMKCDGKLIMNDKLVMICKERAMAHFKVLSRHSLGETKKTHTILVHVRSTAIAAVITNKHIFWNVTPCIW
jgi:hypothetical protein